MRVQYSPKIETTQDVQLHVNKMYVFGQAYIEENKHLKYAIEHLSEDWDGEVFAMRNKDFKLSGEIMSNSFQYASINWAYENDNWILTDQAIEDIANGEAALAISEMYMVFARYVDTKRFSNIMRSKNPAYSHVRICVASFSLERELNFTLVLSCIPTLATTLPATCPGTMTGGWVPASPARQGCGRAHSTGVGSLSGHRMIGSSKGSQLNQLLL